MTRFTQKGASGTARRSSRLATVVLLAVALTTTVRPAPAGATLPTWTFTVSAAVTQATADHYGGTEAVRQLVEMQMDQVNHKFNDPQVFAGVFDFTITEFFVFSGDIGSQIFVSHPTTDLRIVYNGASGGGGWFGAYQSIHHAWPTDYFGGTFGTTATDALTHEVGHFRGAIDLYAVGVNAANNPISGEAYIPETSIMNYPYGVNVWDTHSVHIVSGNTDMVSPPITYITDHFPSGFAVRVVNQNGAPVPNSPVELFPVDWFSYTVTATPAMQGTTDSTGTWTLPSNPFGPGTDGRPWNIRYVNFLVRARLGSSTATTWLPLNRVQNFAFEGNSGPHVTQLSVTASLSSIAITPQALSVPFGSKPQLNAVGTYNDGSTKNLNATAGWSSSKTSVATVSGGLATSTGVGSTTITATSGAASASTTLTVTKSPTSLVAGTATRGRGGFLGLQTVITYNAVLRSATTNATLSGQQVTFKRGTTTLCSATTNAAGLAACSVTANAPAAGTSYSANFAGSALYLAKVGTGTVG